MYGRNSRIAPAERHLIMFYAGQCNNFQGLRLCFLMASTAGSCTRWKFLRRFEAKHRGIVLGGESLFAKAFAKNNGNVYGDQFPFSDVSFGNIPRHN